MSDEKADLLRLSKEYAEKDVDLYELLGVDALTPREDIRRAWRKQSLRYHPDKAGANFDAEKWELFERARDILSDAEIRPVYDGAMKAKLLRKQERNAMDKERKRFADDLEAREEEAARARRNKEQGDREAVQRERERLAGLQRAREEEDRRRREAEQEMDDLAEARRRLKEKKDGKARKKRVKESMLGAKGKDSSGGGVGVSSRMKAERGQPANGVVDVPGDYVVEEKGQEGESRRMYWELVCDKLRAVQAVRNVLSSGGGVELEEAEKAVREARRRIHDAEMQFQRENSTATAEAVF